MAVIMFLAVAITLSFGSHDANGFYVYDILKTKFVDNFVKKVLYQNSLWPVL